MTNEFPPSGEGMPTLDQVKETSLYLQVHNREFGPRPAHRELLANGFDIGIATVQRWLKGKVPKTEDEKLQTPKAKKDRLVSKRRKAKALVAKDAKAPERPKLTELNDDEKAVLAELIGAPGALKRNSEIALLENKVRMALNIILMKRMIAKPELLILDMRGTAALVDSLTTSSKVSGGAAFEVLAPGEKSSHEGNGAMKDVTPHPNVTSIESFERFRHNGKGT